jgi:predicted ester cyclase
MSMTAEENKAIVRRFYSAFEANDEDAMRDVLASDLVAYTSHPNSPVGREDMLAGIRAWNDAFSDTSFEIVEQIAEEDKVATRLIFRTTHNKGDFMGHAPSGKRVENESTSIEHIRDGKIVWRQVLIDPNTPNVMQQLGIIPTPTSAG